MAGTIIDEFEAQYEAMGESLLGRIRTFGEGSWHWWNEDTTYIYARDTLSDLRLLQVLSPTEEGGVTGKRFLFNGHGILKVLGIELSESEYSQDGLQEYILELHRFEDDLGIDATVTREDENAFWEALFLPLDALM